MADVVDPPVDLEPWRDAGFRADLAAYADGERETAKRFARDAVLLARLAARVPRADWDTRGATAWTSFLGELAVARRTSTQLAASRVAEAQQLVGLMPRTLALLEQGELVVARARALIDASRPADDELVRLLDAELAERACHLQPSRIRAAVDKVALQHGVDAAAARSARAAAARGTRFSPLPDGQAEFAFTGPAPAVAQAKAALDADARAWLLALRGTGDGRGIDQLRCDLGLNRLLGRHAQPVAPAGSTPDTTEPADSTDSTPSSDSTDSTPCPDSTDSASRGPGGGDGGSSSDDIGSSNTDGIAGIRSSDGMRSSDGSDGSDGADGTASGRPTSAGAGAAVGAGDGLDGAPAGAPPDDPCSATWLPDPTAPAWWTDRRFSRPVRLDITVPITTALGLSDEPGWLPGYGWVCAPTVRQLLPVAELRKACIAADGPAAGQLVDLADRVVRPDCDAAAARAALQRMATQPFEVTDKTWRTEQRHDPSPALAEFVRLRDRHCDGPVGGRPLPAQDADLDHDKPYDHGEPHDHDERHDHDEPHDHDERHDHGEPHDHGKSNEHRVRPLRVEPYDDVEPWDDGRSDGSGTGGGCGDRRRGGRPRPAATWLVGDGVAWATHGDLGLDLDPARGHLTLVDLGHDDVRDLPRPQATGPTAAWNLVGRGRRPHGLKHRGWTPLRTATSTLWFTPAGQTVEVPHELDPVARLSPTRTLGDPQLLHDAEAELLTQFDPLAELELELEVEVEDAVEDEEALRSEAAQRAPRASDRETPAPF